MSTQPTPQTTTAEALGAGRLEHLSRLFRTAFVWTRRALIAAVILGGGIVMLEGIHLHQLLASVHPVLAWTVSGLLLAIVGGLLGWFAIRWWSVPRAITPPDLPDPARGWTERQRRAYLRFVRRYLSRQAENAHLPVEARQKIPALLEEVASYKNDTNVVRIVETLEGHIDELLEPLDRKARNEIWQCASQVAVLTAVNPSAMLDVLITLLRNLELMARLANMYYARPGLLGTLRIARDVLAVASTAGLVDRFADSASNVAAEMMGSWTARFAGPVGQGITNGLLTVRLGDTAVLRCRSLHSRRVGIKPWSPTMWREMARRLSGIVGEHLAPRTGEAFKKASRSLRDRSTGHVKGAFDWMRGRFTRDRIELPDDTSEPEAT